MMLKRTKGPTETDWFFSLAFRRRVLVISVMTISKKQAAEMDAITVGGLTL